MRFWLILLTLVLPCGAWAQAAEPVKTEEPISIEARVIETTPPSVRAEGDVVFRQGQKLLLADEVHYNYEERTGLLTHATFTTCDEEHMHYKITAREILLTPDQRLRARRVRIFLGSIRLISLPSLAINVGRGEARQTIIPRPGYNNKDGFFLASNYSLIDTNSQYLDLILRLTSKNGVQGGLMSSHILAGTASEAPEYTPDVDSELRRGSMLMPRTQENICEFSKDSRKQRLLSVFGGVLIRERTYDIDKKDLLVSRLPEIGIQYTSPQLCIVKEDEQPILGAHYEARAAWGNYKEYSDGERADRVDVRGAASTTLATYGHSTALRLGGLARYSHYDTGDSYRAIGGALDVSRIFHGGSYASVRFLAHGTSGSTPFEFDDIDIKRELQAAGRYVLGRNTYSLLLDYDLEDHSLRNWEFSISRKMHCLEPGISWRNDYDQISFTMRVLGLN
ncbi:MAG: hypothetical protein ABFD46_00085 [Armatimonadota bacterium]